MAISQLWLKQAETQEQIGLGVEKEHTDTVNKIWEMGKRGEPLTDKVFNFIVQDHLKEDKAYYTKLKDAGL